MPAMISYKRLAYVAPIQNDLLTAKLCVRKPKKMTSEQRLDGIRLGIPGKNAMKSAKIRTPLTQPDILQSLS
jgi:hypothetical protein